MKTWPFAILVGFLVLAGKELSRLRASVQAERRGNQLNGRTASGKEEKSRSKIDARLKKRQPYLEELAALPGEFLSVAHGSKHSAQRGLGLARPIESC